MDQGGGAMIRSDLTGTPVKGDCRITLTHRAVKYSSADNGVHTFPLKNVAHLGEGRIEKYHIPWAAIFYGLLCWEALAVIVVALGVAYGAAATTRRVAVAARDYSATAGRNTRRIPYSELLGAPRRTFQHAHRWLVA